MQNAIEIKENELDKVNGGIDLEKIFREIRIVVKGVKKTVKKMQPVKAVRMI